MRATDFVAGCRDGECILDAERRFENRHQPDRPGDAVSPLTSAIRVDFDTWSGISTLGIRMRSGRFGDDFIEIFESERQLVDAHHALARNENRRRGVHCAPAGARHLFHGMDRVFEVQDDGVRSVQRSVDEVLGFAAGYIETRAAQAVRAEASGRHCSGRTRVPLPNRRALLQLRDGRK